MNEHMRHLYDAGYNPLSATALFILNEITTWYWRGIGFGIGIWCVYILFYGGPQ